MDIKKQLYDYCQKYLLNRIQAGENDIRELQESANEETKSSSGDKYETGRAMMQLEMEKLSGQLAETKRTLQTLNKIKIESNHNFVQPGSLVNSSLGNFFITVSVGKIVLNEKTYMAVSSDSPIGLALMGKKKDESIVFNNRTVTITEVH